MHHAKHIIISIILLTFGLNIAAQEQRTFLPQTGEKSLSIIPKEAVPHPKEDRTFWNVIFPKAFASTINEKEMLRERWRELLGRDIFYPYFQAKKAEEWIKEKGSFTVFNLKGKPDFSNDHLKYIFKMKF